MHRRKAAEARARLWERDAADPEHAARRDATLGDALSLLLRTREEQARAGRRSAETALFYRHKAGHLTRVFETDANGAPVPYALLRLLPREVDRYVSQRREEGASESSIHKELVTLRAALKLARRAGLWNGDPAALLPVAFAPEYKPRSRFLTRRELARLLAELSPDRAARVAFMVATSAEWSATVRALRNDVALDHSAVHLRGTKRTTRDRVVPVATQPQLELLRYALTHAEGEDPSLFLPWQNVRRDLREACKRAGIPPCSPNDLRRTFATWLRAAGAPTDLIAPVMGHADTRMVERVYGRLAPSDLRRRIVGLRGRSRCVTGVSDTVDTLGLFAPFGRPAPRRRSCKFACFPVPRDGVEPPTRGFSIPVENAEHSTFSIILDGNGTHLGHARGLDAAMTAQILGALDAGLADVAQGLLRKLLRRQLGR